jgi:hypothetical protein
MPSVTTSRFVDGMLGVAGRAHPDADAEYPSAGDLDVVLAFVHQRVNLIACR